MTDHARTVVITGAGSGFRKGAARAFADHIYRVWGTKPRQVTPLKEMQLGRTDA